MTEHRAVIALAAAIPRPIALVRFLYHSAATMNLRRTAPLALLVALCSLRCSSPTPPTNDGSVGDATADAVIADTMPAAMDPIGWSDTGSLHVGRFNHTATRLASGKVLVVGGETLSRDMLASVELYDPAAATWSDVPPMPAVRSNHTATLLDDGRVLIAGGGENSAMGTPTGLMVTATALLYDPSTNALTPTGAMRTARSHHQAVRLMNGKVLVIGGSAEGMTPLTTAELYDPATGTFTETGAMTAGRLLFTATRLNDGRVLSLQGAGTGSANTAELYDPAMGTWSATERPALQLGYFHGATLLPSGELLAAGGIASSTFHDRVLRYNPMTNAWTAAQMLPSARNNLGMVTLQSGKVLAVGGFFFSTATGGSSLDEALLYDATANTWTAIEPLSLARFGHTTTLLSDGSVLVVGGGIDIGSATTSCERSVATR